jgi:hypothetical protein
MPPAQRWLRIRLLVARMVVCFVAGASLLPKDEGARSSSTGRESQAGVTRFDWLTHEAWLQRGRSLLGCDLTSLRFKFVTRLPNTTIAIVTTHKSSPSLISFVELQNCRFGNHASRLAEVCILQADSRLIAPLSSISLNSA